MGFREDALTILQETELSLRELIERALSVQRYSEVADVARFAEAVSHLRRDSVGAALTTQSSILSEGKEASQSNSSVRSTKSSRSRPTKGSGFPRFERDGEKLVKIGWSKRDDRIYEHRAPRDVVFLVALSISAKVKPKAVFTMDQVLPVNDNDGNEVPSYQAYLGLAWLRSIGLIQKRGKEGYALTDGALDSAKLERLWNSIPERH
jgi:hypothetical protein